MTAAICCLMASVPAEGAQAPGSGHVREIAPHLVQVGAAIVDAQERTVRCPGQVNMDEGGPIELLACLPRGKTHESVFVLKVEPKDLQVALLLLGLQEGRNPAVEYPPDSAERGRPPGDEVRILIQWRESGEGTAAEREVQSAPAERFLYNVEADSPMARATWAFLGSRMVNGRFGAELDGSLVATYHDPLAILELALPTVNDDIYYVVNKEHCPPIATPIELVIQAPPGKHEGEDEVEGDQ